MAVMLKLRHPNLVSLLHVISREAPLALMLEYLPGGALCDWLVAERNPRQEDLLYILHQVACGMAELARRGIGTCGGERRDEVRPTPDSTAFTWWQCTGTWPRVMCCWGKACRPRCLTMGCLGTWPLAQRPKIATIRLVPRGPCLCDGWYVISLTWCARV